MNILRLSLTITAALLLAGVANGPGAPPAAHAAFPGDNGKIAFVCTGNFGEICTMKPDGSERTQLTNDAAPDSSPRWNADGTELVFHSMRNGVRGIYLMEADGSDVRLVAQIEVGGGFPSFSPDGTKIAYEEFTSGGIGTFVVNTDGSGNTLITPEDDFVAAHPAWSPDGTKIAIHATDSRTNDHVSGLWVMNANGSSLHAITTDSAGFYPDWSPDGTKIAHQAGENSAHVVRVTPAGGGGSTTLATNATLPSWSPDGTKIVYQRTGVVPNGLSIMNADGSNQTVITSGGETNPHWGTARNLVAGVEFTQGVQVLQSITALQGDLAGDGMPPVPIVAGKPAAMRVYMNEVDATTVYEVEATGDVNGSRFVQLEPGCSPAQRRAHEGTCRSLDFMFTPPPGDWGVTLKVRLQQDSNVLEEHEFNLTSVETVPLIIEPVTVCDNIINQTTGVWGCGSLFNFVQNLEFLRATFPGEVLVAGSGSTVFTDTDEIPAEGDWWDVVGGNVRALWAADGGFDNLHHYGVVRPEADAGTPGGIAYTLANAAAGKTALMRDDMDGGLPEETADELIAHLLGLNMGLMHAPSTAGCYGTPAETDPNWPNGSPLTGEVGYDVAEEEPIPATHADWMSLCTPRWISPYTANNVIEAFRPANPRTVGGAGTTVGDFWLVAGTIDEDAGETEFDPIFELETEGPTGQGDGLYTIEVRDGTDSVLATRFFSVDGSVKEDEGMQAPVDEAIVHFGELVPVQPNAAKIVVLAGSNEVGEIELGGTTPVVTLTSGFTRAGAPPLPVFSWEVVDGDSAEHTFWVEFSNDGGDTWRTIAPRYTGTSLTIDNTLFGGGDGLLIRVRASDGVNTGVAVSEPFNMQLLPPTGAIVSPSSGATIPQGNLAWLQAAVVDPEDGFLDGGAVEWTSSRDGALGTGASLHVYDLSIGMHTISLLATDSDGFELADSISVTVTSSGVFEGEPTALAGDVNCSGEVDSVDGLGISRHVAGLSVSQTQPCPGIGTGSPFGHGDVNCSGSVDAVDSLFVLRHVAGLPVNLPGGCRQVGT